MTDSGNPDSGAPRPQQRAGIPWRELGVAWRDAGLLVALAAVCALALNALRPQGLPLLRYAPFDLLGPCPEIQDEVPAISPEKLKPGDPNVVIVDVRLAWDFLAGHLPGAWFLPMYETSPLDGDVVLRLKALRPGTWIVLTGSAGTATAARALTALSGQGLRGLFVLEGGLEAWVKRHGSLQAQAVAVVPAPADLRGIVFVDARDEEAFLAGHREGAVNLPFDDLLPPEPEALEKLRAAKATRYFVYAGEPVPDKPGEARPVHPAYGVAAELVARGFSGVSILSEPWPAAAPAPGVTGGTAP